MSEKTTETGFVAKVISFLKGDDDKGLARKIHRTAKSSVKMQIASLENDLIKKETELELAEEAYEQAKYPTELPASTETYIQGIADAKKVKDKAEKTLASTQESIKYFTELQKEFNK